MNEFTQQALSDRGIDVEEPVGLLRREGHPSHVVEFRSDAVQQLSPGALIATVHCVLRQSALQISVRELYVRVESVAAGTGPPNFA